jgi:hypothetical protein
LLAQAALRIGEGVVNNSGDVALGQRLEAE